MKGNCIDIGTIQAFLDGELAHAENSKVSRHIADCDACTRLLANAEEESAMVFATLEREFNTLVPTQRLWSKINDSITVEKEQTPFWRKAWAFLAAQLATPSIAIAASVLIVFGVFTAVMSTRTSAPVNVQPDVVTKASVPPALVSTPSFVARSTGGDVVANPTRVERADFRPNRKTITGGIDKKGPTPSNDGYMPGEESYVKTIVNLSQSVNGQKDGLMRPSERISYERDMAVVNDAIKKMREEVRKNPKNESAKQVLYTSYQNKIDLLNSVSQREELMASLK